MAPGCAQVQAVIFLLLLVFRQDLFRGPTSQHWCISVRDSDVKDGRHATMPEAVDCHISMEFSLDFIASPIDCQSVLTRKDHRFIRDSTRHNGFGAEVVPFRGQVIMVQKQSAPLSCSSWHVQQRIAGDSHCVQWGVVAGGVCSKAGGIAELLSRELHAIQSIGRDCEPCTHDLGTFESSGLGMGGSTINGLQQSCLPFANCLAVWPNMPSWLDLECHRIHVVACPQ